MRDTQVAAYVPVGSAVHTSVSLLGYGIFPLLRNTQHAQEDEWSFRMMAAKLVRLIPRNDPPHPAAKPNGEARRRWCRGLDTDNSAAGLKSYIGLRAQIGHKKAYMCISR